LNTGSEPINYFSTTWTVPQEPSDHNGQTIFLWMGITNSITGGSNSVLVQPVMQWGQQGVDGWNLSNWCVWDSGDETAYTTATVTLNPGTSVTGVISYTGNDGSSLNYSSSFTSYTTMDVVESGDSYHNTAPFPAIPALNYAVEVLESDNCTISADYPSNQLYVAMSDISLQTGPPNSYTPANLSWVAHLGSGATLGEHAFAVNDYSSGTGQVDLYFQPQPAPSFTYFTPDDLAINQPITPLNPSSNGPAAASYSVSPALPAGLSLNSTTGVISGTPTQLTPATNYVITGTTNGVHGTFTVNIVVGNTYPFVVSSGSSSTTIYNLVFNGNTVLSGFLVVANDVNNLNLVYTLNSNSTVVFQAESGYMPVSGTLYGNFAPINGTVVANKTSGLTTITFTGVNLSGAQCQIVIN